MYYLPYSISLEELEFILKPDVISMPGSVKEKVQNYCYLNSDFVKIILNLSQYDTNVKYECFHD